MKTNEILEGNKLIAEFMGWGERGIYRTPFDDAGMCNGEPSSICYDRNLRFNSDWNWLMLVVEKIESLGYDVFINGLYCRITDSGLSDFEIESSEVACKIESVFSSCVDFAEWYKNQSKQIKA